MRYLSRSLSLSLSLSLSIALSSPVIRRRHTVLSRLKVSALAGGFHASFNRPVTPGPTPSCAISDGHVNYRWIWTLSLLVLLHINPASVTLPNLSVQGKGIAVERLPSPLSVETTTSCRDCQGDRLMGEGAENAGLETPGHECILTVSA